MSGLLDYWLSELYFLSLRTNINALIIWTENENL